MAAIIADSMFPDRCDIYLGAPIPARSTRDNSGGRPADPDTVATSGAKCSIQPAGDQEILAANAIGVEVNTKVYFKTDPGDLRTGSRIVPTLRNGTAPTRATAGLSVQFLRREDMYGLTLWTAFCLGRD